MGQTNPRRSKLQVVLLRKLNHVAAQLNDLPFRLFDTSANTRPDLHNALVHFRLHAFLEAINGLEFFLDA